MRAAIRCFARFAGLILAYVGAAKAGFTMAFTHGTVSPVWPASGIAIAALTLLGPRWFPAITLGALWANAITIGDPWPVAAGIVIGNTLEAVLGAVLLRHLTVTGEVTRVRDALIVMVMALLAPLPSATLGVLSLSLANLSEWGHYGDVWLVWWIGDAMGALFLTPLVLAWGGPPARPEAPRRIIEALAMLAVVAVATNFPFVTETAWDWLELQRIPVTLFILPPLAWGAIRLAPRWSLLALETMMLVAIWHTARGNGPFFHGSQIGSLVMLQMIMAATGGIMLVLISAIVERDRHADQLSADLFSSEAGKAKAEADSRAKSQFVAALGHDMKQPLQAARLFLDVLKGRQQEEKERTLVERTGSSLDAMGAALDSLKDITAVECNQVTPDIVVFPLGELLGQLAEEYRLRCAERGLNFRFVRYRHQVRTDPQLLARILRNLLSNAVRYTRQGGILLGCRRDPGGVRIEIWDTGPGIPTEDCESIFLAFHRVTGAERLAAPGEGGGLGLGLATVQRLAALLDLRVTVHSQVGRGSMFSVVVPYPHP